MQITWQFPYCNWGSALLLLFELLYFSEKKHNFFDLKALSDNFKYIVPVFVLKKAILAVPVFFFLN